MKLSCLQTLPIDKYLYQKMFKKFQPVEFVILAITILLIFISEYYYLILKEHDRAIFIGLWPATILLLLIYANIKKLQ